MNIFKKVVTDYKIWNTVRKVALLHKKELNDAGYEVTYYGMIYTVINLNKEIYNTNDADGFRKVAVRDERVYEVLKRSCLALTYLLVDLNIADLVVFPDYISQIDDSDDFLVEFKTNQTTFTLKNLFRAFIIVAVAVAGMAILVHNI